MPPDRCADLAHCMSQDLALLPHSLRCGDPVRSLRYLLRGRAGEPRPAFVWTGGALQEKSVNLEHSGLAPMYPAFGWSS